MLTISPHQKSRGAAREPKSAHLIGIGGAGMTALAQVLVQLGWSVTGSDSALATSRKGRFNVHARENVPADVELVIVSDAVPADNCERLRALELGIPSINYAQMLGRLMDERRGLAVAGTHGKSTTTAMIDEILAAASLDPTVVMGAEPLSGRGAGRAGRGAWMLAEACEYRRNFLQLRPQAAVILGIEPDHFDCYPNPLDMIAAYSEFASQVAADGRLVIPAACRAAEEAARSACCEIETFGAGDRADWHASDIESRRGFYEFRLRRKSEDLGHVRLRVAGRHQVHNAVAAAALASAADVGVEAIIAGLNRFVGLQRRLEFAGLPRGVTWIDDYAHHPSEVSVALASLREMAPIGRIIAVFQPHQASRLGALFERFALSLLPADEIAIADVFRAREPIGFEAEATAADLAARVRELGGNVWPIHDLAGIEGRLAEAIQLGQLTPGDIIITMGAGDLGRVGAGLSQQFSTRRMAG